MRMFALCTGLFRGLSLTRAMILFSFSFDLIELLYCSLNIECQLEQDYFHRRARNSLKFKRYLLTTVFVNVIKVE